MTTHDNADSVKFVCRWCGDTHNPPHPTGDCFYCCRSKMQDNRPLRKENV